MSDYPNDGRKRVHSEDYLEAFAFDNPGPAGDHSVYLVEPLSGSGGGSWEIKFQRGPIIENGVNGVSNEALLGIIAHRLRCFQAGPYKCIHNEKALSHIQGAMDWLEARTRDRQNGGVEGTNQA